MIRSDDADDRDLLDRIEAVETMIALDEAYAELERGEGRPLDEALFSLRRRLGMVRGDR